MSALATILAALLPTLAAIVGSVEGRGAGAVRRIRRHLDLMNDLPSQDDKAAMQELISTEVKFFSEGQSKRARRKLNWFNVGMTVFFFALAGGSIAGLVLLVQEKGFWWLFLAVPVGLVLLLFVFAAISTVYDDRDT